MPCLDTETCPEKTYCPTIYVREFIVYFTLFFMQNITVYLHHFPLSSELRTSSIYRCFLRLFHSVLFTLTASCAFFTLSSYVLYLLLPALFHTDLFMLTASCAVYVHEFSFTYVAFCGFFNKLFFNIFMIY